MIQAHFTKDSIKCIYILHLYLSGEYGSPAGHLRHWGQSASFVSVMTTNKKMRQAQINFHITVAKETKYTTLHPQCLPDDPLSSLPLTWSHSFIGPGPLMTPPYNFSGPLGESLNFKVIYFSPPPYDLLMPPDYPNSEGHMIFPLPPDNFPTLLLPLNDPHFNSCSPDNPTYRVI